jgi:hypothetical protein
MPQRLASPVGSPSSLSLPFIAAQRGEERHIRCSGFVGVEAELKPSPGPAGEDESEIVAEAEPAGGARGARSMDPRGSYATEGAEGASACGASHEMHAVAAAATKRPVSSLRIRAFPRV